MTKFCAIVPMEAATIAGLVLGVIPLIISAVENYEVTFQPFVTYKRHVKEIRRFTARLDTQRAIFHNECQLLLVAVGQNLGDILGDPNHPSRNDGPLSRRLEGLLGTSYNTCVSTLNVINDTLAEVTNETVGFKDLLEGHKSKGNGTWSMFRQKIKISFSKTRLNDITNELRDYNEDLGRISAQIRRLGTLTPTSASTTVTNTTISHIRTTQQASIRLYDVLASGWSSDDCTEHVATMSLRVEQPCRHTASKVRFSMSVACTQQTVWGEPLWLAIESAPSESLQKPLSATPSTGLQSALQKMGAAKRSVKFDLTSTTVSVCSPSGSWSNSQTQIGPQLDLCTMGKLCRYFRQMQVQAARSTEEPCIGFLEKTKTFRRFVYPNQGPKSPVGASKSPCLKDVLQKAADEKREQDWISKLRLAKLLSLAVLRFHSTPWLSETWTSSDVHLLGDGYASQTGPLLEDPYVEAQLSTAASTRLISRPSANASSLAANPTLFNLGVVLVELGNDAPFENLYEKDPSRGDILNQVADFIAARRLGESVHKKLNMTYDRLVEKCLNCNFGVATKLDDAELQSAVVVHVVNELDVCLEQYKAFNSLAPPILCG